MCETCAQCMTSHEDAKKEKPKTRLLASMATPNDEDKEMEEIRKDIENQRTDKFIMKNGEIYTTMGKKWITARKRMTIIKEIPQGLCHAGGEKTWQHMRETHDMKDMKRMIQETINNCEACLRTKTVTQKTKEDRIQMKAGEIFEKIYIDICGPWKETFNRERYIIAIIDQFSKYISLTAIRKQDENTIQKIIQNNWILKFGSPKEIHVDCGRSFESRVIREMMERLKIKLVFSSPYHHKTNGIIERQFRTIREYCMATLKDRKGTNWADILPEIEYTLNSTVQKTTGKSPAEIVFGKRIDRFQWHDRTQEERGEIIRKVREKTGKIDTGDTRRKLEIGDEVWIKKEVRNKEDDKYEGPYRITEKVHDRCYRMENDKGNCVRRNVEQLKFLKRGM